MEVTLNNAGNYSIENLKLKRKKFDNDRLFSKIDLNTDGSVNKDELSSFLEHVFKITGETIEVNEVFSTYDSNGDNLLSKDEFAKLVEEKNILPNTNSALSENEVEEMASLIIGQLSSDNSSNPMLFNLFSTLKTQQKSEPSLNLKA